MKSSPLIWRYVVNVKSTVKILSIFVAFLENMNFILGTKVRDPFTDFLSKNGNLLMCLHHIK